jgi:hypothetical protein
MKIKTHNNNSLIISLKAFFKKHLKLKRLIISLILVVGLIVISLASMYFGMKIYESRGLGSINYKIHDFAVTKLNFIPNYFYGIFSKPDKIIIDIKFEDLEKLRYHRDNSFAIGYISPEGKNDDIPANLTYNDKIYKITMSLTGSTLKHVGHTKIWSYRIKLKDDASIFGMKEFNLLYPEARGYLSDWIGHKLQEKVGLIALRINYINVTINGDDLGLYCLEESYDKILIENNQRKEGVIFKWGSVPQMYSRKKILKDPNLYKSSKLLEDLIKGFTIDDIGINKVFDLDKMAKLFAINDLLNGTSHGVHLNNVRFYFNPITNLIEPIGREWAITTYKYKNHHEMALGVEYLKDLPFYNKFFSNPTFMKLYINELNNLSRKSFLDNFFNEIYDEKQKVTNLIYKDNPFYVYPKEFLYNNQNYIRSMLYQNKHIATYFSDIVDNKLQISVRNLQCLPVKINEVTYGDSLLISPTKKIHILNGKTEFNPKYNKIDFLLPEKLSSSNLSNKLNISYKLLGIDSIFTVKVFPWPYESTNSFSYNFTKQDPNYQNFDFLTIDETEHTINFDSGMLIIAKSLVIPMGYKIIINDGTKINLIDSASIITYSPIYFSGTSENPITITSSDSTGEGIFVLRTKGKSMLNYVQINSLSNPSKNGWELSGAVTFYEADVSINNCIFLSNQRGDDFLNIIKSEFDINNTLFKDILSDAFDSDFCIGSISHSLFINCGNDAIDISGTKIEISNVVLDNIGDKGLSSGENSQMIANNIEISNSEIAICSKDLSTIIISDINLQNNKIGFTAFQKKPEFGPAVIKGLGVKLKNITVPYLIESKSNCSINGEIVRSSKDNVKDILYGNQYGKSSK